MVTFYHVASNTNDSESKRVLNPSKANIINLKIPGLMFYSIGIWAKRNQYIYIGFSKNSNRPTSPSEHAYIA